MSLFTAFCVYSSNNFAKHKCSVLEEVALKSVKAAKLRDADGFENVQLFLH